MGANDKENESTVFNADFIMNQMAEGVRKEGMKPMPEKSKEAEGKTLPKEKGRGKKMMGAGYEEIFFTIPKSNARNGKPVYISAEFHERLSRIVQVIGEDKLSIYAYLNNVLEYHFHEFGDDIIKSFNEKYKPIL